MKNKAYYYATIVIGVLLLPATSLLAAQVTLGIGLDFISGPLAGASVSGSIIYDSENLTGEGLEVLGPEGNSAFSSGLLGFSLNIGEDEFTLESAVSSIPALYAVDGVPTGFSYVGTGSSYGFGGGGGSVDPGQFTYFPTAGNLSVANITLTPDDTHGSLLGPPNPEPTRVLLCLLGFGAMALRRRRC